MGMVEIAVKLLMLHSTTHDFSRSHLVTIGKQGICFSVDELKAWAQQLNFTLNESQLNNAAEANRCLTDIEFFKSLGFRAVDSMDCSDYEGASIICNLNVDIPDELHDKFDIIYDGGSTEHMFNVPKAFENYNKMLKVGGLVIHSLPSTGCLDHGFYMFSPTLFFDYYSQNKWEIAAFYMINIPCDSYSAWEIYEYSEPGPSLEDVAFDGRWTIFFIARKQAESAYHSNIEQHFFSILWRNRQLQAREADPALTNTQGTGLLKKIYRMLPERFRMAYRSVIVNAITAPVPAKKTIPFRKYDLLHK